jgi:hypothetical protein
MACRATCPKSLNPKLVKSRVRNERHRTFCWTDRCNRPVCGDGSREPKAAANTNVGSTATRVGRSRTHEAR